MERGNPFDPEEPAGAVPQRNGHHHDEAAWAEMLARSVAHLAAQLTMMQIQFRALATELERNRTVAKPVVMASVSEIARTETGRYLRENLGEALTEVIDVDALESDLIAYLTATGQS